MADSWVTSPRRARVLIDLHPGEITSWFANDDFLERFSEEELRKIVLAINNKQEERIAT